MLRAVLAVLSLSFAAAAWSQAYPSRPLKIVVPYGVGGSADVYGRFLAAKLQDSLGQAVVVENRPGGGSIVGTDVVAKSDPDGYTLLMMSNTHTVNETLIAKKPFELMRDFAPITGVSYSDLMMVVHPSLNVSSLKEFIALAKSRPGALNYASSGNGTPYHMAGELFKSMAGVNIVHIPHKGSDQARASVMGGQVQMMFDAVPTMAASARAGKVKALATSGAKRSPVTPDVPTVAEAGVPGYEFDTWFVVAAPKGTSRAIVDTLNSQIRKALTAPDQVKFYEERGLTVIASTPEEAAAHLESEQKKWGRVIKERGIKAQ
jgi:tripartite-type tricarboxylate transporter receptor subunit TctC